MNTMDLKLNREMLSMTRTILDASCEQAVEKDFLLPDYYPDIFRVLKCVITPTVQSHSINGGKLSFDMAVLIRVLYISQKRQADKLHRAENELHKVFRPARGLRRSYDMAHAKMRLCQLPCGKSAQT